MSDFGLAPMKIEGGPIDYGSGPMRTRTPEESAAYNVMIHKKYALSDNKDEILRAMLNVAECRGFLGVMAGAVDFASYGLTKDEFLTWFMGGVE